MINIPFRLMSPRWRETSCNLCIMIGAIVGGIGIVFLFIKGFADTDAWLATLIGVVIFFVFLWVKSIRKKHEEDRLEHIKSLQTEHEKDLLERDWEEINLRQLHILRREATHEMARDEARHGKALEGLLKRYFK